MKEGRGIMRRRGRLVRLWHSGHRHPTSDLVIDPVEVAPSVEIEESRFSRGQDVEFAAVVPVYGKRSGHVIAYAQGLAVRLHRHGAQESQLRLVPVFLQYNIVFQLHEKRS